MPDNKPMRCSTTLLKDSQNWEFSNRKDDTHPSEASLLGTDPGPSPGPGPGHRMRKLRPCGEMGEDEREREREV